MRCFRCGKRMGWRGSYCPYCGTPALDPDSAAGRRPVKPGRPSMPMAVGLLLVCLLLLGGGAFAAYRVLGDRAFRVNNPLQAGATTESTLGLAETAVSTSTTESTTTTTLAPATTTTVAPTTTSSTLDPSAQKFMTVATTLAATLTDYRGRLAQLTATIDSTAPDVPQTVFDQLDQMVKEAQSERHDLTAIKAPSAYSDAQKRLSQAALYMARSAQYTLAAVKAMDHSGHKSSGKTSLAKASTNSKKFESAFTKYQELIRAH